MWDVASVSFYVRLPLVPPQVLSLASECFIQTHYSSTFILNRQSSLGFNEGGEHTVSKSEFCQEEGGPGDLGQAYSYLPPWARLSLPHPVWKELRKSELLARISDYPSERLVNFWGMEQTRTKTNMTPQQTEDAQHTHIWKKTPTEYLVGLERSIFEILCQHKQESLSLICDSKAS